MEENKSVYALKKVNEPEAFCSEIKAIKGVKDASVDVDNMILEYVIDEWTSDYDVFTQVMTVAESYGCEFDFDRDLAAGTSADDSESEEEAEVAEKMPEEEYICDDEDDDEAQRADGKPVKKKKGLSERNQRIIELSVAVIGFIVALFFKDVVQLIMLAVAFAVAGYEVLYRAIVKITKKEIISEELVLSLSFFGAILLGKPVEAVAAVLLYSVAAFAFDTAKEIVDEKSPVYVMSETCRKAISDEKAVKTKTSEIAEGDEVFFKKNEKCLFDGFAKNEVEVVAFDGTRRTIKAGEKIYAGERVISNVVVVVEKTAGNGLYDGRNLKALEVIQSRSKLGKQISEKKKIYLPCIVVFCLLLAFLPPLAYGDYTIGLMRWGYTAAILAALCPTMLACGAEAVALFASVVPAKEKKVIPPDYDSDERIVKADEVLIDVESVIIGADGKVKEDCRGAALELADFGRKTVAVTSLSEDKCIELCTENKIPEYYAGKNDGKKVEVFDEALKAGKIVVMSESTLKKYGLTRESGVIIAYADEEAEYKGDATVGCENLSRLPFVVKLAARTVKIGKTAIIVNLAVKGLLALLAIAGIAGLWWAVLADTLVGVASCVAALANGKKIY